MGAGETQHWEIPIAGDMKRAMVIPILRVQEPPGPCDLGPVIFLLCKLNTEATSPKVSFQNPLGLDNCSIFLGPLSLSPLPGHATLCEPASSQPLVRSLCYSQTPLTALCTPAWCSRLPGCLRRGTWHMISGCCLVISVGADQGRGEEASVFGTGGGPRGGLPALPLGVGVRSCK